MADYCREFLAEEHDPNVLDPDLQAKYSEIRDMCLRLLANDVPATSGGLDFQVARDFFRHRLTKMLKEYNHRVDLRNFRFITVRHMENARGAESPVVIYVQPKDGFKSNFDLVNGISRAMFFPVLLIMKKGYELDEDFLSMIKTRYDHYTYTTN